MVVTKNSPEGTETDVQIPYTSCLEQNRVEVRFSSFRSVEGLVNSFVHSWNIRSVPQKSQNSENQMIVWELSNKRNRSSKIAVS